MRQYVRAWINEWDLRRLDPAYVPDIAVDRGRVRLSPRTSRWRAARRRGTPAEHRAGPGERCSADVVAAVLGRRPGRRRRELRDALRARGPARRSPARTWRRVLASDPRAGFRPDAGRSGSAGGRTATAVPSRDRPAPARRRRPCSAAVPLAGRRAGRVAGQQAAGCGRGRHRHGQDHGRGRRRRGGAGPRRTGLRAGPHRPICSTSGAVPGRTCACRRHGVGLVGDGHRDAPRRRATSSSRW